MKALIYFTAMKEIDVPEGTLTTDAQRIVNKMTSSELIDGAIATNRSMEIRLPHASVSFTPSTIR